MRMDAGDEDAEDAGNEDAADGLGVSRAQCKVVGRRK
jgi:hypothetical protein